MTTDSALHLLNFVNEGEREISISHKWLTVRKGDLYFIPATAHIEDGPRSKDFQEQTFLFTPTELHQAVFHFVANGYEPDINTAAAIPRFKYRAGFGVRTFFQALRLYGFNLLSDIPGLKSTKLNELWQFISASNQEGAQEVLHTIIRQVDQEECQFKAAMSKIVFDDLTIYELAALTNKSLTSFKNFFQRVFNETPHRWIIRQRLLHARLLVVSTNKSIAQIGNECKFSNISHFIKLFKREFGTTPLSMRQEQTKYNN